MIQRLQGLYSEVSELLETTTKKNPKQQKKKKKKPTPKSLISKNAVYFSLLE